MQASIKLWVEKIQDKPLPSLSLIRDLDYLKQLLQRLEHSYFKSNSISTFDQLVQQITEYYRKEQKLDVSEAMKEARTDPDVTHFWVLVLGIAIRCKERNENIQLILNLDEKSQSSLMNFIGRIDDTLASCPSLELESSKREVHNLERHLLDTIDQMSEENSTLRAKIQELQQEFNAYKISKQTLIQTLEQQLQHLHAQKLDVLNEYQGFYNTDNMFVIFKAIQNENRKLKGVIDQKDEILQDIEKEMEQMRNRIIRLTETNTVMKVSLTNLEPLQAQVEQQQAEIQSLRANENQHLERIFSLQKGHSPSKMERNNRALGKAVSMHPIQQEQDGQPRGYQSYKPPIAGSNSPQKLIRSARKRGSVLSKQLEPYEREKQNVQRIKQLQELAQKLASNLQSSNEQMMVKLTQNKYLLDKIKQLQEKVRHVQNINQIYSKNVKDKQLTIMQKDEEYEMRFCELMEEIEALKVLSQEKDLNLETLVQGSTNQLASNSSRYQQKMRNIMNMLETELINFRNKELEYLEAIRQLKLGKGSNLLITSSDMSKSVFDMERSGIQLTLQNNLGTQVERAYIQQKNESGLVRKESRMSRVSQDEVRLQAKIIQLQQQMSKVQTIKNQVDENLKMSLSREKVSMEQIQKLHQQNLKLMKQLSTVRQQFDNYLREQILRLKSTKSNQVTSQSDINAKMQRLQQFSLQIQEMRGKRESSSSEVLTQRDKLVSYLKQELKEFTRQQSTTKPLHPVMEVTQDNILNGTQTIQNKQDRGEYQRFKQMQNQLNHKVEQHNTIRQLNLRLQTQISQLKNKIISLDLQKQNLASKIRQLESKSLVVQSDTNSYYRQVSHLLDLIQVQKESHHEKDKTIETLEEKIRINKSQHREPQEPGTDEYGISLKRTNQRMVEQMKSQSYSFALFRNRYSEMLQKYNQIREEHALLTSTLADLVISVQ